MGALSVSCHTSQVLQRHHYSNMKIVLFFACISLFACHSLARPGQQGQESTITEPVPYTTTGPKLGPKTTTGPDTDTPTGPEPDTTTVPGPAEGGFDGLSF